MINRIYTILTQNKLNWFLDSGSLLGIRREGAFLQWDKGVDISILMSEWCFSALEDAISAIELLGFTVIKHYWGSALYKVCFATPDIQKCKYNVDLHLFFSCADEYRCPQISFIKPDNLVHAFVFFFAMVKKGDPCTRSSGFIGGLKHSVRNLYKAMLGKRTRIMDMKKYVPQYASTYYWCIPGRFVDTLTYINTGNYFVPVDTDGYLEFRYGDWTVPKKNWSFLKDDGSVRACESNDIDQILIGQER